MRPAVRGESIAGERNPDGWRLSLGHHFCSNQSVSYTYDPHIPDERVKWRESMTMCNKLHDGCLARVWNNNTFTQLHEMLYKNSMENNTEKYWVGIQYRRSAVFKPFDRFWWGNGQRVSSVEFLLKIVDLSSVFPSGNRRCIAITREDKLKPMNCNIKLSYVCQTVANATTSPPSVTSTTSPSTESAATTTSQTTASTAKVTSIPTSSATEVTSKPALSTTKGMQNQLLVQQKVHLNLLLVQYNFYYYMT
ncbi:hypothetical protein AC249_AIPGENE13331 [Exaiptasia diaphana]|nr:hypothetical protein AC249_AIPGENE13331 [Exaiptasia diaphana]